MLTDVMLLEVLRVLSEGRENAEKSHDLTKDMQLQQERTSEPLREIFRQAIVDHHIPIGSCNDGYFIINTEEEYEAVIRDLNARVNGIQERMLAIEAGWEKRKQSGGVWPYSYGAEE